MGKNTFLWKTFGVVLCYCFEMAHYKIKDLEQLTGIKAHTIRMWEKRYGILTPDRTETHIRNYSDRELSFLLNVALLNKHGIKISRIADMSHEQIINKVLDLRDSAEVDTSQEKLVLSLVELDEALFRQTLGELIFKHGLEDTFTHYLLPFLEKIGIMWMVGSINPAQEHFVSNLIRQRIICEIDKLPVPENSERPVMLFLPEHEWHEISLLFYHFVLRSAGLHTIYLGQSVPYDAMLECVEKFKPACLVTSWITAVDERFIKSYFQRLYEESGAVPVFAGGYQIRLNGHLIAGWATKIDAVEDIRKVVALATEK